MAYSEARDAQLPLRMSKSLKAMLVAAATKNNRSVNAEVVLRLAQTFGDEVAAVETAMGPSALREMAEDIRALRLLAEQLVQNGTAMRSAHIG